MNTPLPGIAYYMETEEVLVSAIWDGEFPWYGGEKLKLVCKEHYFFSTISDSYCHLCSQISRANTYKSMKDGSYIYRPAVGNNSSTRVESESLGSGISIGRDNLDSHLRGTRIR